MRFMFVAAVAFLSSMLSEGTEPRKRIGVYLFDVPSESRASCEAWVEKLRPALGENSRLLTTVKDPEAAEVLVEIISCSAGELEDERINHRMEAMIKKGREAPFPFKVVHRGPLEGRVRAIVSGLEKAVTSSDPEKEG